MRLVRTSSDDELPLVTSSCVVASQKQVAQLQYWTQRAPLLHRLTSSSTAHG